MTELAAVAVRRRAQRGGRVARPRADAGRAARRPDARAGQQGVAGRRRSAGPGGGASPARSCRSTPSTRRWPSACAPGSRGEVRRLVLTASGGPFRGRRRAELADVTPEQALAHPTWNMGPVVTINSATLVNKGLEVIEAHELFGVAVRRHRGDGAPAVGDPLDGRVRRRLDASPRPARRTCGCRSRWRWAGPTGCRTRPPAVDWTDGAHLGAAPARRARRSRPSAGQGGRRGRALPAGDLQRGQRGVRGRVRRRPAAVPGHRRHRWRACLADAPDFAEPGTVEDVLAAESWARAQARELIVAAVTEGVVDADDRRRSCSSRWHPRSRSACTRPATWSRPRPSA